VDVWKGFRAQADALLRSHDFSREVLTVLGQLDDARSSLYELQLGIDTGSAVLNDEWFDLSSMTDALKKEAGRLWWNVPEEQRDRIPNALSHFDAPVAYVEDTIITRRPQPPQEKVKSTSETTPEEILHLLQQAKQSLRDITTCSKSEVSVAE
jgi:hypothetical protein